MGWLTAILALLGKVFDYFTRKDERDVERDAGEKTGVVETQAATAQRTVEQAKDAAKTDDDVGRLSDDDLNRELRGDAKT